MENERDEGFTIGGAGQGTLDPGYSPERGGVEAQGEDAKGDWSQADGAHALGVLQIVDQRAVKDADHL